MTSIAACSGSRPPRPHLSRRSSTSCRSRHTSGASSRSRCPRAGHAPRWKRRPSPRGRTPPVACARACPTTTSSTRPLPRSTAVRRARRRRPRMPCCEPTPGSCRGAAARSPTRSTTRPVAARPRTTRTSTRRRPAPGSRALVSYLRGSSDRAPDGPRIRAGAPYATWATRTYTVARLSAWFAADPRTRVGTLTALDLRDTGVSGRLISVTLIGSGGTKKVSGEVFRSVFNAGRPAATRCSAAPCSGPRRSPDPRYPSGR